MQDAVQNKLYFHKKADVIFIFQVLSFFLLIKSSYEKNTFSVNITSLDIMY